MAIVERLTKLKSAMKRWPSFSKHARSASVRTAAVPTSEGDAAAMVGASAAATSSNNLHAVYVGKSRRRYFISSAVAAHPLFRELVVEAADEEQHGGGFVVACEVVLFEHLLWMLQSNAAEGQLGAVEELVEFYTC
ncbi:hypothetical protein SAY86_031608 [Trapa natans]|uniref:Uncharacterized protein n=1 Tax=Trapa natans TaxID=22666 RepID=A0AAN7R7N1_TRANT|nr:hypothetical protein SAY86_031608 [Trapa natans]